MYSEGYCRRTVGKTLIQRQALDYRVPVRVGRGVNRTGTVPVRYLESEIGDHYPCGYRQTHYVSSIAQLSSIWMRDNHLSSVWMKDDLILHSTETLIVYPSTQRYLIYKYFRFNHYL